MVSFKVYTGVCRYVSIPQIKFSIFTHNLWFLVVKFHIIQVYFSDFCHLHVNLTLHFQSLSARNKLLLQDKKKLLIQNKMEFDRLEGEKVSASQILLHQLSTWAPSQF